MSLEVQIETLNSNIVALINALQSLGNGAASAAAPVIEREIPLREPAERPSKVAERIADEKPEPPAKLVTFEDVKRAVLKLAAKDRAAAVKLLSDQGVKKVTELPESAWTKVCFAAEEALDAKEAGND